jgi:regulation of enolase protein 1 (concanavalin A-like superfamily)
MNLVRSMDWIEFSPRYISRVPIMSRCCTILALACVPIVVLAAPVPKEDDAARILRRTYGETIDRDGDCKFEMPSEKLRLTIPGKPHFLERKLNNAPRVAREIEGDFTITVRVTFPIRPAKGLEAHQADSAIASAGVIAWSDDDGEMVWILRSEFPIGGEQRQGFLSNRVKPKGNEYHNLYGLNLEPTGSAYLRIARQGSKVSPTYSGDGKTWYTTFEPEVGWGKKVKVGVIAEHGYKVPFVATFDEYKLEQPK